MVVWNRLPKSWKLGEKWRNCTVECDEITSRHTKHANQCKTDFRNLPDMLNPVHQAVVRHVAKVWKRLLLWLWPRIFRRSICHFADFDVHGLPKMSDWLSKLMTSCLRKKLYSQARNRHDRTSFSHWACLILSWQERKVIGRNMNLLRPSHCNWVNIGNLWTLHLRVLTITIQVCWKAPCVPESH